MAYTDKFIATDNLVSHLNAVIISINDPALQSSYSGFFSVSAVTVYELAIKAIFLTFAEKKHKVFGAFINTHFSRINGKINISDLRGVHIKSFGDRYLNKFNKLLDDKENNFLRTANISISSFYGNLVTCRHKFVHTGSPTLTLTEAISCYTYGKEVIHCLNHAMQR